MPGGKGNVASPTWFEDFFGFKEGKYQETQGKFEFSNDVLVSKANGSSFHVGAWDVMSLEDLRARLSTCSQAGSDGGLTFKNVAGDTRAFHRDPENAGAVFQVASQFNCLEMNEPGARPEDGVTRYYNDKTQGPACAVTCPAATVFRNYFVNGHGQFPKKNQVDCLSAISELVQNDKNSYWRMVNGYCLPEGNGTLAKLGTLIKENPSLAEQVRSKLQVGIHWDTEVSKTNHRVCQVFSSALPVSYAKSTRSQDWQPFACCVLDATFEATLAAAAILAAERKSRVKVYLTAVGGGAFGNRSMWIVDALDKALKAHAKSPLDVFLVTFGTLPKGDYMKLETKERGGGARGSVSGSVAPKSKAKAKAKAKAEAEVAPEATPTQKIISLFAAIDTNGDGVLDEKEMSELLQKLDPSFTKDEIAKLFDCADANDDGMIHYSEFVAWVYGEDSAAATSLLAQSGPFTMDSNILQVFAVKPYGVLGAQMLESGDIVEQASQPGPDVCIVDPAGLPFIQGECGGPSGAGGASGQIYTWLGIGECDAFPDEVKAAIKATLRAKFQSYGAKKCIHVVGPNFNDDPCSRELAVAALTQAYHAVFSEFIVSGLQVLRVLPVSGGIFAGEFLESIPELTAEALQNGFALLSADQQDILESKSLELCIFSEKDLPAFTKAIADAGGK